MDFFEIASCKVFSWGWFWTEIILTSASWVTRITDGSHWHPAAQIILMQGRIQVELLKEAQMKSNRAVRGGKIISLWDSERKFHGIAWHSIYSVELGVFGTCL
jgi:hypothetical protein